MKSLKAGTVGPFPLSFAAPFLLPYFLTAFVLKVMENGALRRHLDLVDILLVFLKLNLETLLLGVILWPLFYLRRWVRIVPVFLIYLTALLFNFVSYAVSLRFSTPINAFILGKLGEYLTFLSVYLSASRLFWQLSAFLIVLAAIPIVCRWIFLYMGRLRVFSSLSFRFWISIPICFALLSLPAFFFLTAGSRLSSTFFESTVRSLIYHYSVRESVLAGDRASALRQVLPIVERKKKPWLIPPRKKLNVVIYLLETIPYHFFNTGNPVTRKIAPALRSIAKHSVVYRNHYTTSLYSNLAFYSLLTGNFGVYGNKYEYLFLKDHILHKLKKAGYSTAILTTVHYRMDFMTYVLKNILKFDFMYEPTNDPVGLKRYKNVTGFRGQSMMVEDQILVDRALEWLKKHKDAPVFMILQPQNSHYPYWCPKKEFRLFEENTPHGKFLNAVRCQDDLIDQLVRGMESLGISDNTLLVIVSDHGLRGMFPEIRDSQLEDEESPLYNEVNIRAPWLVYNKKLVPATSSVDDLSSGVDLMPTILDMVGVDYDPKKFDGRSIYRNEKNGAVVVTLGYNREGIALVEEDLKFKFNYLTNSGVLYRKREPKINSRNDPNLRNRVADWTERALLWEKLTAGVRRGRTPAGVSR